jgi:hypothetical protein
MIVYHLGYASVCLALSLVIFAVATVAIYKIYTGSKSVFAYTLLAFAYGYGL